MARGVLSDAFGFRPERNRRIVAGIDVPMDAIDFVSRPYPAEVW